MRPKASQLHLHIAAAFANAITVRNDDTKINLENNIHAVKCRGPTSIFSALNICIPDIVRQSVDGNILLKGAVSEIELNKFLSRSGYISSRLRNRIKGTKDKWTKGFQRWKFLRWLDPRNPEELRHLRTQLAEIPIRFPGSYFIHESRLIDFISNLWDVHDEPPSLPAGHTNILDAFVDGEHGNSIIDNDKEDNQLEWDRSPSAFSPPVDGAEDLPPSPQGDGLQLAARGGSGELWRWRMDAIPFSRIITHHR
jgi:hypothetical protein